jgi:hypothetical protein
MCVCFVQGGGTQLLGYDFEETSLRDDFEMRPQADRQMILVEATPRQNCWEHDSVWEAQLEGQCDWVRQGRRRPAAVRGVGGRDRRKRPGHAESCRSR